MAIDYVALRAELDAGHPVSGVYNVDDQLAADQMNVVDVVTDQEFIPSATIFDAILNNKAEWEALVADDRQWVRDILTINSEEGVPTLAGTPSRTQLIAILGTNTKAEIALAIPHTISRATELSFGKIIIGDVQNARAI